MTSSLKAGEVVLVDLGYTAKVRPCVVFAPKPDSQRNIAIVVPLTTEIRGGECEIPYPKPAWLRQPGVLNLAGITSVDHAKVERRLGPFPVSSFKQAKEALAKILDL
jgi:mRNA interferase MazF